jgi:hypothetical protein
MTTLSTQCLQERKTVKQDELQQMKASFVFAETNTYLRAHVVTGSCPCSLQIGSGDQMDVSGLDEGVVHLFLRRCLRVITLLYL